MRRKQGLTTRLLQFQLPVSEMGGGRWTWNIPDAGVCLFRMKIIRDDVCVSWDTISETENKIQEAKDHTHVGDECLVDGVGYYGTNDLRRVRI